MSREAIGENNAILGSSEYWKRLNESTLFGSLMRDPSTRAYYDALRTVGERADAAVTEVYEDLQDNLMQIAGVSSEKRSALAKRLGALYDVCNMSGASCRRYSDCIGILELSFSYVPRPDREVENALQMLERDFSFTVSEGVSLLQSAVDWGFDRATWRDERKIKFLLKLMQGNGTDFLKTILDAYRVSSGKVDVRGKCGYELGSSEYLRWLEKQVFLQELPPLSGDDYAKLLRDALETIAKQLERDLSTAERENSYITDPIAIVLRSAASELARCNISPRISDDSIDRLAWFVGGDAEKIRQLQRKLNELNITDRLTEDGVYGKKTLAASNTFAERLARGAFPAAALINPLQSRSTKIYSVVNETQKDGVTIRTASLRDRSSRSRNKKQDITVFKVDPPHEVWPQYHHINTVRGGTLRDGKYVASPRQLKNLDALNHREISEQAYKLLKNFNGTAKKVRVAGGTILAVAGDAAEILELSSALYLDWSADGKLGKDSLAAGVRVMGDWGVSLAASEFGSWAGATIGTFFMPGVGTAIGGAAGGLVFGIIGSFAGDALEEWVIDITGLEE